MSRVERMWLYSEAYMGRETIQTSTCPTTKPKLVFMNYQIVLVSLQLVFACLWIFKYGFLRMTTNYRHVPSVPMHAGMHEAYKP